MGTFRHTFFARLSLLLLVAVLHVDLFAELCGALFPVADGVMPGSRVATAVFEPGDPASLADKPLQLLDVQESLEAARVAACLHRTPRLSRPLPDSGYAVASEGIRRAFCPDLRVVGRILRAHYSLYCVYRI